MTFLLTEQVASSNCLIVIMPASKRYKLGLCKGAVCLKNTIIRVFLSLYAKNTAIKASKNIKTPPTMGRIIGATWAIDSTTSSSCAAAAGDVAVWSVGWDIKFLKILVFAKIILFYLFKPCVSKQKLATQGTLQA